MRLRKLKANRFTDIKSLISAKAKHLFSTISSLTRKLNPMQLSLVVLAISIAVLVLGMGAFKKTDAEGTGIQKIKHVIVVMQENRSFDHYFGTYPGADGIPMDSNGNPTVCAPDPDNNTCQAPFVDHRDIGGGGGHGKPDTVIDENGGAMDGFVKSWEQQNHHCANVNGPLCTNGPNDVMGYHTGSDIPNYWSYANNFVLQDRMFAPTDSWSLPEHLQLVSGWSALCTTKNTPSSCQSDTDLDIFSTNKNFAWTDLTYLLHKRSISWGYYVTRGTEPDCESDEALTCDPVNQSPGYPSIWNPLPQFDTVRNDNQVGNIQGIDSFYNAAKQGTLPAVSWVVPSGQVSEHAPGAISAGQSYVTSLVNTVMSGPEWNSTAIFISWDDWGGYYDHVMPPNVDQNGYGIRVPGLVISPYAKHGVIDHQTLSFDAYLKFIEDDFLGGQRIDPATDGRPDPRPNVRENASILGDLTSDFDFTQLPRSKQILPVHPNTTLVPTVPFSPSNPNVTSGNGQATIQWSKAITDGGSPLTGYLVTPNINGVAQTPISYSSTATSQIITGLTNSDVFTFTVSGVNAVGTGYVSEPATPITIGTPTGPISPNAIPGNGQATVSWGTPASDNGSAITGYIVTPYIGGNAQTATTFNNTNLTQVITGLTNGQGYRFMISAINSLGTGHGVFTNLITVGSPLSPRTPSAKPGNGQATVSWSAPSSNNGSAVTGYIVTTYIGTTASPPLGKPFNSTAISQVITGLVNGKTYTFKISAINANGVGPQSVSTVSTTVGSPLAPTGVKATAGTGSATLSWTIPASANGAAITGYIITPYKGVFSTPQPSITFNSTTLTQTITGLTKGIAYKFTVSAKNARGTGPASLVSNAIVPN
ncbi:MAG TPA: alkaline phosphatase family protein [Patescibacteria group bacterium]|nr:alkaline phosphatase family protein [Patescibacteria group bacterium]